MPDFKLLTEDDWITLQEIRLSALSESPHSFLSSYETEKAYDAVRWCAEFTRGDWAVGFVGGEPVSLIGATREPGAPSHQRYLEFLWVSPSVRRQGIGFGLIDFVLDHLKRSGARTVFLWVLDGNDSAMRLYQRVGFARSNDLQPLEAHPGRSEERLRLDLG